MSDEIVIDIFTRLRQRWKALAGRILHDDEEVEDALQEAFCRLWVRRSDIHTTAQGVALTAVTLRNVSIDRYRHLQSREVMTIDEQQDTMGEDENESTERTQHYALLQQLVEQRLSETQRYILYAHEYDELTLDEIAQKLHLQPAAVRMQLSRARKLIRQLYHEQKERL